MSQLQYHAGKAAWIEARASVLVKLRGMSEGTALAKARAEFRRYAELDSKRERLTAHHE